MNKTIVAFFLRTFLIKFFVYLLVLIVKYNNLVKIKAIKLYFTHSKKCLQVSCKI
jgi:hypothetical protein